MVGTTLSAWTTAFTKKDMKPSLTSCFLTKRSWNLVRSAMMLERSTSLKVVRCAVSCCAAKKTRGDFLAQRGHLSCGRFSHRLGAPRAAWGSPNFEPPLSALRFFGSGQHIALEDAAVFAGAGNLGRIDAFFFRLVTDGGGKIVGVLATCCTCGNGCSGFDTRGLTALRRSLGTVFLGGGSGGFGWRRGFFINLRDDLADLDRVAGLH